MLYCNVLLLHCIALQLLTEANKAMQCGNNTSNNCQAWEIREISYTHQKEQCNGTFHGGADTNSTRNNATQGMHVGQAKYQ